MSSEQEERRQQTSPTAGQMSRRRRHGSQKRLGAVRHQVILSASHGIFSQYPTICFFSRLSSSLTQSGRARMWQTGQHPAKDPHTYIPRRQPHDSKTLGEGQRPTPRLSIDGVWGSQTGEVAVVGGLVESFSLGGRRSWGAKLGVRRREACVVGSHVLETRLSWIPHGDV
jgi:hypothetical protein